MFTSWNQWWFKLQNGHANSEGLGTEPLQPLLPVMESLQRSKGWLEALHHTSTNCWGHKFSASWIPTASQEDAESFAAQSPLKISSVLECTEISENGFDTHAKPLVLPTARCFWDSQAVSYPLSLSGWMPNGFTLSLRCHLYKSYSYNPVKFYTKFTPRSY